MAIFISFGIEQIFGFSVTVPEFITPALLVGSMAAWTLIPLVLAVVFFNRRGV